GADKDMKSPKASPIYADDIDLGRLPPALIITAEYDPLRDEGEAYGKRLEQAGVPVKVTRYGGQIHGFFGMTAMLDGAKKAVDEAGRVEHPHVHGAEWSADVGEHVERVAEAVPAGVGDERPVGRGDLLDGDLSGEMVDALADAEDDVGRRERGQQAGRDRECD